MNSTKGAITSIGLWGVLIAAAGTVADSQDLLSRLIGGEWADKAVIVAGLILAFYGRLVANKEIRGILPALALIGCVFVGGCSNGAGNAARESLLSPAAQLAWPDVKANALYGIDAKIEDGVLDPQTAAFPRETVRLFDEAVTQLGGGE